MSRCKGMEELFDRKSIKKKNHTFNFKSYMVFKNKCVKFDFKYWNYYYYNDDFLTI